MPDDSCSLVVASHVLEHVVDSIGFTRELLRIPAPGGQLWIQAPSELACLTPSTNNPQDHSFLNFWDNPTHVRPWPPAALYRLAIACQAMPVAIERGQAGDVPVATLLARKGPGVVGKPHYRYVTLKDVPHGLEAAYQAAWNPVELLDRETEKRRVRYGLLRGKVSVAEDFDASLPECEMKAFEGR